MRINSNWQCYQTHGNVQANDLRLNANNRARRAPLGASKKARLNFSTKGKLYSSGMEYYGSTASANTKLNWVKMRTANLRFFFVTLSPSKSSRGWAAFCRMSLQIYCTTGAIWDKVLIGVYHSF